MNGIDEYLEDKILNSSDDELMEIAYLKSIDYRDDVVQFAISEVRRRGLKELNIKHCPNCRAACNADNYTCKCGYNFQKPNPKEIERVRTKRSRRNRIMGLVMILIGGFFLSLHISNSTMHSIFYKSDHINTDSNFTMFTIGIPACLVLIGIYKFISGAVVRNPNKSGFLDGILWDSPEVKGKKDNAEFVFCLSCSEQMLAEMEYKNCPHCGKALAR